MHRFDQPLQFAHRSLRLQDQSRKSFSLFAEGTADGRQIGAGELQVATGLLKIRQRHLQFIHRMVRVAEQGLQLVCEPGIGQELAYRAFAVLEVGDDTVRANDELVQPVARR